MERCVFQYKNKSNIANQITQVDNTEYKIHNIGYPMLLKTISKELETNKLIITKGSEDPKTVTLDDSYPSFSQLQLMINQKISDAFPLDPNPISLEQTSFNSLRWTNHISSDTHTINYVNNFMEQLITGKQTNSHSLTLLRGASSHSFQPDVTLGVNSLSLNFAGSMKLTLPTSGNYNDQVLIYFNKLPILNVKNLNSVTIKAFYSSIDVEQILSSLNNYNIQLGLIRV